MNFTKELLTDVDLILLSKREIMQNIEFCAFSKRNMTEENCPNTNGYYCVLLKKGDVDLEMEQAIDLYNEVLLFIPKSWSSLLLEQLMAKCEYSYDDFGFVIDIEKNICQFWDLGYIYGREERKNKLPLKESLLVFSLYGNTMLVHLLLCQHLFKQKDYSQSIIKLRSILPTFNAFCASHGVEVEKSFTPDPEFLEAFPELKDQFPIR